MTGTQDQEPITDRLRQRLKVDMGHLYGPPRPPHQTRPRRTRRRRRGFLPRTWADAAAAAATLFFLLLSAAILVGAYLLRHLFGGHG